jgi:hypothetical protein
MPNPWWLFQAWSSTDLAPVRDPEELAGLPQEERIPWEKFWAEAPNPFPQVIERAPPPRELKR